MVIDRLVCLAEHLALLLVTVMESNRGRFFTGIVCKTGKYLLVITSGGWGRGEG